MLVSLRIENMAIIDSVYLEFHRGFNVLTGETGAGKSIVLGALDLLLGGRASTDVIRANCDRAEVEGLFEVGEGGPRDALLSMDLAEEEGSTLLIRRVVARNGRSRVTVNGRQVTTSMLRSLTRHLVDMSSQHAHYALLSPDEHLHLLDRFGECGEVARKYQTVFEALKKLESTEKRLQLAERERLEREDFIRFQLKEIEEVAPEVEEDEILEQELERLRHGESLRSGSSKASNLLSGNGGSSATGALHSAVRELTPLVDRDPALQPLLERASTASIELEDLAFELARYGSQISTNPGELHQKEERLSDLRKLKRKYGVSLDAVLEKQEELQSTLLNFENLEDELIRVREEREETEGKAHKTAMKWRQLREKSGKNMAQVIESELGSLALPKCRFQVLVEPLVDGKGAPRLTEWGSDQVTFEIAPNPGEGFKPLNKVASGGELSRILLAIKSALILADPVETSIYDEVDSGIGGGTAEKVGKKLKTSASRRQVIAITHLAQTVAFGDRHFLVEKSEHDGRTSTEVHQLSEVERAEEMARMLGGVTLTRQSRAHAQEMLDTSLSWTPQA